MEKMKAENPVRSNSIQATSTFQRFTKVANLCPSTTGRHVIRANLSHVTRYRQRKNVLTFVSGNNPNVPSAVGLGDHITPRIRGETRVSRCLFPKDAVGRYIMGEKLKCNVLRRRRRRINSQL